MSKFEGLPPMPTPEDLKRSQEDISLDVTPFPELEAKSPSDNNEPLPQQEYKAPSEWLRRELDERPKDGDGPHWADKYYTQPPTEQPQQQEYKAPSEWLKNYLEEHPEEKKLQSEKPTPELEPAPTPEPPKKPVEEKTLVEKLEEDEVSTPPNFWTGETPKPTQGFETAPLAPDSDGEKLLPEDAEPRPPKERVSLFDKIEGANWDSEEAVNLAELGVETGWFKSAFNKISIKMGWSKDIVNYAQLSTVDKLSMNYNNFWNDRLINKKRGEVSRLDRRIRRESNSKTESVARENLIKIDKSIEEARKSGNKNLEDVLLATRGKISTEVSNKRGRLEDEKNSLTSQLERYGERKVAILDNFVASVEIKTENIRNKNNYYENIKKRSVLNNQIESLLGVVSQTESEIISLRKALAFTKDKEDKRIIKDSIKEYKRAIKESQRKRKTYEKINRRLGSFIELTDKRTDRFDALKDRYVGRRGVVQKRAAKERSKKEENTPPPPQQKQKEQTKEPEITPQPQESETNNKEGGELYEKRDKIKKAIDDFLDIIKTKGDSTPEDGKKIVGKAIAVHTPFFEAAKNETFKETERKIFGDAERDVGNFIKKIDKNGNVATEADKASMRTYMSNVKKKLRATNEE